MTHWILFLLTICIYACQSPTRQGDQTDVDSPISFVAEQEDDQIVVYRRGYDSPIVTQHAKPAHRPYIHPIYAPNSNAELTQYSPDHHKHQTGLYWGFTRVNGTGASDEELKKWFYRRDKPDDIIGKIGRDYFHFPGSTHWKRVSSRVLIGQGEKVRWQTVYHMLDDDGQALMEETQVWSFSRRQQKHLLELEWKGKSLEHDVTINKFDYGGLFLRMPWHQGIEGEVITEARHRDQNAEGQRSIWVDVGMEIEGLQDWGHIAILDHPDNPGFPNHWRVDHQLGIGPIYAKKEDWKIRKGETITFRHQIVAYEGKYSDVEMKKIWSDFVDDHGMYSSAVMWNIARAEGRDAKFLTPEEAVKNSTVKEGYRVNAFANEPMITQPMAFCWDDRGRMWIAENRDYENRREGFSNAGDSRILILEDTDRDGVADKEIVFLEHIPFPSAIAVGFDGLFLGAVPNLLFVPDRDRDDRADVDDIRVLLTGWGIRDRHETINSLHWGPDGWLYGLEGFATPSKIRKPDGPGRIYRHMEPFPDVLAADDGVEINGGVWRYHPIKERFEVVAHGFSNPWGIDYDAKGQMFISACVIPHAFHVIQGGIYHRQGGKHFNPYVYQDIKTIVDHRHRSAHGGARVYLSDAFPADQYGRLFMANIHEHAVLSDILQRQGSGFVASHGDDFMMANNAQWIGFSMELGPEGGLYVLDWHDADICGNDVLNKETGRVFRIMPEQSMAENFEGRYEDLRKMSDLDLVNLQLVKSSWHARRARVILQNRAHKNGVSKEAAQRLQGILSSENNGDFRLNALWTLHVTNLLPEDVLLHLLDDHDEYVRAWVIQFLAEDHDASSRAMAKLVALAANDPSPVVRLYLAISLQRTADKNIWAIAEELVQHSTDADDHNIPLMIWFGIEPLIASGPDRALALATKSKMPLVTNHIARRLVDADKLEKPMAALQERSGRQVDLLKGIVAGMEGRNDLEEPDIWTEVYATIKSHPQMDELAAQVAQHFGGSAVAKELLATLKNPQADDFQKQEAIAGLAAKKRKELVVEIPALLQDPSLRLEAIKAIAAYDENDLGQVLLERYASFGQIDKQMAIHTFASRPVHGRILAQALKQNKVPRRDVPPYVALQLRRVVGNGFVEIWGPMDELPSDKASEYTKYQRLLSDRALASASAESGKAVFLRTCGSCHRMYGEGANMGPDLTGSNRANIPYLLSNIIEPSRELQDDYKMVVVTTQDGRTYSGNIIAESDRQLTMRIVGQEELIINKSEIRSKEVSPKSMMPEGLLNTLTESEILDLVAFLQTTEDVSERLP